MCRIPGLHWWDVKCVCYLSVSKVNDRLNINLLKTHESIKMSMFPHNPSSYRHFQRMLLWLNCLISSYHHTVMLQNMITGSVENHVNLLFRLTLSFMCQFVHLLGQYPQCCSDLWQTKQLTLSVVFKWVY